ncbi:MAG: cytochrome b/b6 domain-containing protein [Thermodesulfobacteriota bacterium]
MKKSEAEVIEYKSGKSSKLVKQVNEHPWLIRFTHWLNMISLFILIGSGLRIFLAFPSFGSKVPQENFFFVIPKSYTIGGWLGGAIQWHFTFIWVYMLTGVVYLTYQFISGHYKTFLFTHKDISGVLPMAKHYFLFRSKPELKEQYNPLQKLAYTSVIILAVLSMITGFAVYKPVQIPYLTNLIGGYQYARYWHQLVMWAFIVFIIGHLIMVILHGWNNFVAMLTGWKKNPEYILKNK